MNNFTKDISGNINTQKRWLNPKDLELEYGFSKSWQGKARMISNTNSIPFHKVSKFVLYDRQQIDRWIEEHEVQGVLS